MNDNEIMGSLWGFAFKEYRTAKCSKCHVIVRTDASFCPHCGVKFLRDD